MSDKAETAKSDPTLIEDRSQMEDRPQIIEPEQTDSNKPWRATCQWKSGDKTCGNYIMTDDLHTLCYIHRDPDSGQKFCNGVDIDCSQCRGKQGTPEFDKWVKRLQDKPRYDRGKKAAHLKSTKPKKTKSSKRTKTVMEDKSSESESETFSQPTKHHKGDRSEITQSYPQWPQFPQNPYGPQGGPYNTQGVPYGPQSGPQVAYGHQGSYGMNFWPPMMQQPILQQQTDMENRMREIVKETLQEWLPKQDSFPSQPGEQPRSSTVTATRSVPYEDEQENNPIQDTNSEEEQEEIDAHEDSSTSVILPDEDHSH